MANSKAITTTFWGISATFSGSLNGQSYNGKMVFAQEVAIGSLMAKDWEAESVSLSFPYGNKKLKAFTGKSFDAEWKEATKVLKIYLTNNQHWFILAILNEQNELQKYCLVFEPKKEITIKKFPGIQKVLNKLITVDIAIYFACKDILINSLDIKKGISFRTGIKIGSKAFSLPTAANTLVNCGSTNTPISINQPLGDVIHIDTLGFEYREGGENPINKRHEPNQLFLELKIKNTPLTILKGNLKAIRIGFVLDKLHSMERFSWESNLALEVDFDIPVTDTQTGKNRLLSLRPMQWLRKIGFPPSWFPSLFKKNKPRPEATKGITITKNDLKNIDLIKVNDDYHALIPDETVLERVVYDWKTHDLELAVKVKFQSPLSKAELQNLESQHPESGAFLTALQKEATAREIDTTNKSIEDLKKDLNSYTGDFPLNNYPEIFKVNQVAIYINPKNN